MNATVNQATGELTGQIFDPQNILRREVKETHSIDGGTKYESERLVYDFGLKGNLLTMSDYKLDLKGGLSYLDNEHFGLHGERTWEQKTTYKLDGFDTSTWHVGLDYGHAWTKETTTYKPPPATPGKPAKHATSNAQSQQTPPPSTMQVGLLFPLNFHAGETVTGSLWPASYAEGFKTIPGLSEYTFPIELAYLPGGTPSWPTVEIGVKGDGYSSVNPNGTFSLHIPSTWTGPLQLQTRDSYSLPGAGPTSALLDVGNPVAAPALPSNLVSPKVTGALKAENLKYLKHLWNLAYDLEEDFNAAEEIKDDDYYWATIDDLEEYEYYLWNEIDDVIDTLPPSDVAQLASDQIKKADECIKKLEDGPQTPDNVAELKDMRGWADFLDDEEGHAHWLAGDRFFIEPSVFWTNPVLTQGKLGALRGNFLDDPLDTNLHIGTNTIWPLAATGSELYFMPPISLTPGPNNLFVDGPGMPPTELPIFYMTLTMWADQLSLQKGQSTTYYVKLDGLNGLPSSAWSSSFIPTDLVSPSDLGGGSGASSAPGNSQSGYITLAVTNESPGTITMQNTFSTLDAKFFAPSGSYQISGGVGAIADGGFSILGVARAYLQPALGFGYPQGSTLPVSSGFGDSIWNPSTHLDYKPDSTTGLYSLASCSSSGSDTPCTGGALPPNTALIGDTPPAGSTPPATTGREAAEKAVKDAEDALRDARSKVDKKEEASAKVWKKVREVAPAALDAYKKKISDDFAAQMKLEDAWKHLIAQPSPENFVAYSQAAAEAAASQATADGAFESLKLSLPAELAITLNYTNLEYQDAMKAADKAYEAVRIAEEEANFSLLLDEPAPTPPGTTPPTLRLPSTPPPLPPPPPPPPPPN